VLDVERLSASAKAQLHLLREQALAGGGGGEAAGPQRTSSRGSRPLLSEGSGHQLSEESQQQPPPPAQLPPAAKSPARPRPQQAGDREGTPSKRRRRAASTPSVSSGQAQQQVQAQGLGASEALLRNTERHLSIISEVRVAGKAGGGDAQLLGSSCHAAAGPPVAATRPRVPRQLVA
jgi:hypothetical protein